MKLQRIIIVFMNDGDNRFCLLVTQYQGTNFGSSLQAFALKKVLSSNGLECRVLMNSPMGSIKRKFLTAIKLLAHPELIKRLIYERNQPHLYYSPCITSSFAFFEKEEIKPIPIPSGKLRKLARDEACVGCFCGSDQIWSPYPILLNPNSFLSFSPKEKNTSYACSLGLDYLPRHNRRKLGRLLKNIKRISVREATAANIIANNYGLEATVCLDPVFLLAPEEWESFASQKSSFDSRGKAFAMFLEKPSKEAFEKMMEYAKKTEKEIIFLSRFQLPSDSHFFCSPGEFSPYDFVEAIRNASFVFTDSFHATVFSLIFEKDFFTFARRYENGSGQSSRITDLLFDLGLGSRYFECNAPLERGFSSINFDSARIKLAKKIADSKAFLFKAYLDLCHD